MIWPARRETLYRADKALSTMSKYRKESRKLEQEEDVSCGRALLRRISCCANWYRLPHDGQPEEVLKKTATPSLSDELQRGSKSEGAKQIVNFSKHGEH